MPHYDVLIIGSGFGGSVSALRLAEKGYSVGVLEAGRRYNTEDFATTNWNVRKYFFFPRIGLHGILRMDLLGHVLALSGAGVGGGSLGYGNTLYEPHDAFFKDPQWADITDWRQELAPYYQLAKRMLGVCEAPADSPADDIVRKVAAQLGVEDTFQPTQVGVFFGSPGVEVDDPYFGGAGPRRSGCIQQGGCMVGCRHNAKNTLDKNYLYLAEKLGVEIHPRSEAIDLVQLSTGGWQVTTRRPGPRSRSKLRRWTADHVIFSAGGLGTTRLLLKLAERGRLPHMSDQIGHLVRTNSEVLLGATAKTTDVDYSQGVAISSSIHPEPRTHIEPVRYPRGSGAISLLATILTDGGPGMPRPLRYLLNVVRHPIQFLRSLSVWRWAERTVILLVMQSYDNSIQLYRKKGRLGSRLASKQGHGDPNPTFIPIANEAARIAAQEMEGMPVSAINEVLLDRPATAHLLGGAPIGSGPHKGVVDPYHRMYGHDGLHVVDGAAVCANLGVNPSLSITAMAERAMAAWPNKGQADPRPDVGSEYEAVTPERPAVHAVDLDVLGMDPWG